MVDTVNDILMHAPINADNVRERAAVRSREGLWRRNLRAVDVLCEATNLRDLRQTRDGFEADTSEGRLVIPQILRLFISEIRYAFLARRSERERIAGLLLLICGIV